jgi:hypothetical protein
VRDATASERAVAGLVDFFMATAASRKRRWPTSRRCSDEFGVHGSRFTIRV